MARPEIQGLKYFPFDVGFFRDKKVRLLRGEHNAEGVEIYLRLVCKCYEENGYYLQWDSDADYALLAEETGYTIEKVRLVVSTCLKWSLFDNTLFMVGNVLTSRGIQRRYFSAVRETKMKAAANRRNTFINADICLLTEADFLELNKSCTWLEVTHNDSKSENNECKSTINPDNSTNNPANEIKGNKRKEREIPARHKYGQYGWVVLTDAEYQRLVNDFGDSLISHYIAYVDEYAQSNQNKNKYKDWNLIVRKAIRDKWGGDYRTSTTSQHSPLNTGYTNVADLIEQGVI